jgi:multiple sugar transport system substrate-binding protein
MTLRQIRRKALAAGAILSLALLAACSGGGSDDTTTSAGGNCLPAAEGEKVTLTFTSWVPGMQKTVDLWNQQNPNIQVQYKEVAAGARGTYQTYANQIKAGNTDDLGMVEFDSLPSFRMQDGLANIGACPGVAEAAAKYVPWTMKQVAFGEPGAVYGVPQDVGPLALYYRKDLFESNGIAVPATWDEFYTAAKQVKAKGGLITNFPPDAANYFAALAWQNGANWFGNSGSAWTVSMTDEKTKQVADYWQRMITEKLVDSTPALTDTQFKALETDRQWSVIGAAWTAKLIENGSPGTAGKWGVVPLPQWQAGQQKSGNWGGSTTVVFKNSKHPAEAAKFAFWAFGNLEALALNNTNGGQFPATTAGETQLPALTQPYPYFGDQVIWKTFQEAAAQVDEAWQWGPTMTQTFTDLADGLSAAINGQGTVLDALTEAQQKTITTMKSQAIQVTE